MSDDKQSWPERALEMLELCYSDLLLLLTPEQKLERAKQLRALLDEYAERDNGPYEPDIAAGSVEALADKFRPQTLTAHDLHTPICGAAPPAKLTAADPTESAPYWLCYSLAERVSDECERAATIPCNDSSLCITEWCPPCAASAWLLEQSIAAAPAAEAEETNG